MEIIETKIGRTHARVRYDLIDKTTRGDIYTKAEKEGEETFVGYMTDEVEGTATFHILSKFEEREYIKADCEELRKQFIDVSNMWAARQSRGWA